METVTFDRHKTKPCPFCAETIQLRAVKCRFCNEFLNTKKAKTIQASPDPLTDDQTKESVLFTARPSLWSMLPAVLRALLFFALAAALYYYPLENLSMFQPKQAPAPSPVETTNVATTPAEPAPPPTAPEITPLTLTDSQKQLFAQYRIASAIGLAALVTLILLLKALKLKMTRYEVTADRIEHSRGILDRQVDNLDMFRVIDLRMRRTFFDLVFGIGTVTLTTSDESDPQFSFKKIHRPRKLYDIIKNASLDADRKSGVVHLE